MEKLWNLDKFDSIMDLINHDKEYFKEVYEREWASKKSQFLTIDMDGDVCIHFTSDLLLDHHDHFFVRDDSEYIGKIVGDGLKSIKAIWFDLPEDEIKHYLSIPLSKELFEAMKDEEGYPVEFSSGGNKPFISMDLVDEFCRFYDMINELDFVIEKGSKLKIFKESYPLMWQYKIQIQEYELEYLDK